MPSHYIQLLTGLILSSLLLSACGGGGGDNSGSGDTNAPTLTQVTAVTTPTTDTTPSYTFSTSEAGTIAYSGSCNSATTEARSGENTVTFNALSDGSYSNCALTVMDASNNISLALSIPSFTIDTVAPTLVEVTAITTPANDSTPTYTFNSSELGTITVGGACSSAMTAATSGANTITFNTLEDGEYSDCTIQVTDLAGHVSNELALATFTIYTVQPVLSSFLMQPQVAGRDTPTISIGTPWTFFRSSTPGAITYGGPCSSSKTSIEEGDYFELYERYMVRADLNRLEDGTYSTCTITVTDALGNSSEPLQIPTFIVAAGPQPIDPVALNDQAIVEGAVYLTSPDMKQYRGIPYAEAPVGQLRFAPPVAKELVGTIDARTFGSTCPQSTSPYGTVSTNEDCLFLNVFAPTPTLGESGNNVGDGPYPVMVWIHGGAFLYGSGSESAYNPQDLVNQGVIVVTLNYRLGALGFLTHPDGIEGNFGLMDQQLAMQWVRNHIAAFNGDPENVTLFGESAGGHSVLTHMVAPSSAPYFDKAIVQSGSYLGYQIPLATAQFMGSTFAADPDINCADVACLRELPVSTILANQSFNGYIPTWNTNFLPNPVNTALSNNAKPVMLGTNLREGQLFAYIDLMSRALTFPQGYVTNTEYKAAVASLLSNYVVDGVPLSVDTEQVAAQQVAPYVMAISQGAFSTGQAWDAYAESLPVGSPMKNAGSFIYSLAYGNIYTNSFFACPASYQLEQLMTERNIYNIYAYQFTDVQSPHPVNRFLPTFAGTPFMGATHTSELQYLFGNRSVRSGAGFTSSQQDLANNMVAFWTNFAKTGEPGWVGSGASARYWPAGGLLHLDDSNTGGIVGSTSDTFRVAHSCDYWDGLGLPLLPALE